MSNRVKSLSFLLLILLAVILISLIIYINSIPDSEDLYYLAEAIYHEARSEPVSGMIAVGQVIMNRTQSPNFPNTIEEVIKQPKQFSYRNKGQPKAPKNKAAYQLCKILSHGILTDQYKDYSNGAEFYLNKALATDGGWAEEMIAVNHIGKHTFYKEQERESKKIKNITDMDTILEILEEDYSK